ncbi:hypothetical protein DFH11DRAFT_1884797 [Phellopilus nigrolimitatus]|nr:hypothetical protein DFH11DRAFT_1884797 [Phellopilus nigrolimitatus]
MLRNELAVTLAREEASKAADAFLQHLPGDAGGSMFQRGECGARDGRAVHTRANASSLPQACGANSPEAEEDTPATRIPPRGDAIPYMRGRPDATRPWADGCGDIGAAAD